MPHITALIVVELVGLGLVIGAVSPTFGIGGGLLTVPILILLYNFSSDAATATSLGVIVFSSVAGSLAYVRERRIDYRVALLFIVCALPGSLAGAAVAAWLKSLHLHVDVLQIAFAGMLGATGIYRIVTLLLPKPNAAPRKAPASSAAASTAAPESAAQPASGTAPVRARSRWPRTLTDRRGKVHAYTARVFPGAPFAVIGGFLGAMLGLGGGVIYVPILTMALGVPAAIATATSTFTILFVNPFALLVRLGSIQWAWALILGVGVAVAAWIVPRFLHRISDRWILTGFWVLATLAALRLVLNVLGVSM